jgi:hypothetical protein
MLAIKYKGGWFDVGYMLWPACVCVWILLYHLRKEEVSSETWWFNLITMEKVLEGVFDVYKICLKDQQIHLSVGMQFYYTVTTDILRPIMWPPSGSQEQKYNCNNNLSE